MPGILRIGFFENFKSRDTLLLSGDDEAMHRLTQVLLTLAAGGAQRLQLDTLPSVQARRGITVLAERAATSSGLCHADQAANGKSGTPRPSPCFHWKLTANDWEDVASRVAVLQNQPGHQYPGDYLGVQDDVPVMVSANEYDEAWWRRHA